jgi:hypothetical protein
LLLYQIYDGTRIKKSQSRGLSGSRIIIMIYSSKRPLAGVPLCVTPRIMKLVKGPSPGMLDLKLLLEWQQ